MRRRRRLIVRLLLGLLAVILIALVGGYLYAKPLLLTGTGYAAHNACAVKGIAGRSNPDTDLPPNPLVPYLRTSDATDSSSVTTTVLGVLAGQTAYFTGDYGCTLGEQPTATTAALPGTNDEWRRTEAAQKNPYLAAPAPTMSAEVTAALARAFGDDLPAAQQQALGTRGIVVLVDGHLVAERYAPGFTATTPQLGWSMSKSVANLLTGRLVQQGKVALTDAKLRPEWTDNRSTITVDQLMRMTSGLQWDETYDLGTTITRMLYMEPDMAGYVAGLPAEHAPGTYLEYSSGSTNLLCSVLRAKAGAGPELPYTQLIVPLGLGSAVWEPDGSGTPVCSSYLWATPRDWATIGQFALQNGAWRGEQLLPTDWMATSTTAQPVAQSEEKPYAAGWWVNKGADGSLVEPSLPADTYWASGHDGQRLYVVPSAGVVVARLGFSPSVDAADLRVVDLVRTMVNAAE